MLRDALLSTALYVCLGCAARVLGARYQRREAREDVHTTQPTDTDMMVAISIPVAPAGEVRVVVLENEAIFASSTLNTSHGQMATDSAPRRSERVTRQPAKLLDGTRHISSTHYTLQKCGMRTQDSDSRNAHHLLAL